MFTPQSSSGPDRNMSLPVGIPQQSSDDVVPGMHQRRTSVQMVEDKKLARRVVDLENELHAVREEATSRKSSDAVFQRQVNDMANRGLEGVT